MNSIGPGHEHQLVAEDGNVAWKLRFVGNGTPVNDIHLIRCDTDGLEVETTVTLDWSAGTVSFSAADLTIPADAVDSAQIADGAVDPVHLASGVRTLAADAAFAIAATDRLVEISASATATTAITMTATHAGHIVFVKMLAGDADSLYTAAVTGGTVTFNAAEEAAALYYDGTDWRHLFLTGATFA